MLQSCRRQKGRVEADQEFPEYQQASTNCLRIELANHECTARSEHTMGFLEKPSLVPNVMQCINDQHAVHRPRLHRKGGPVPTNDADVVCTGATEHSLRGIEDVRVSDVYRPDATTRTPADVEDAFDGSPCASEGGIDGFGVGTWHQQVIDGGESFEPSNVTDCHGSATTGGVKCLQVREFFRTSTPRPGQCIQITKTRVRSMEFEFLGMPEAGPTLELDHERFAYAGNFRTAATGKTVARETGTLLGAVAFNRDRTDDSTMRLRYVTVRDDRRDEGIGSTLLQYTAEELLDRDVADIAIAVNNPIAFQACYRAGFVFTGEERGMHELLCHYRPAATRDGTLYRAGLEHFRAQSLPEDQHSFVTEQLATGVPAPVDSNRNE